MKLRGRGLLALGVLGLVGGCGAATGSPGAVGPTVGDYRVHAETLPATPRTPYGVMPSPKAVVEPGACPAGGLRVAVGAVDGAMGLRADTLTVTNCGAKSLTVSGYPQVRVLDEDGKVLDVEVHQGSSITTGIDDPAPTRIALKPGQQAQCALVWRLLVTRTDVPATTGTAVRVVPAPAMSPQVLPLNVDLGNTGKLDVLAWQAAPARAVDGRPAG